MLRECWKNWSIIYWLLAGDQASCLPLLLSHKIVLPPIFPLASMPDNLISSNWDEIQLRIYFGHPLGDQLRKACPDRLYRVFRTKYVLVISGILYPPWKFFVFALSKSSVNTWISHVLNSFNADLGKRSLFRHLTIVMRRVI